MPTGRPQFPGTRQTRCYGQKPAARPVSIDCPAPSPIMLPSITTARMSPSDDSMVRVVLTESGVFACSSTGRMTLPLVGCKSGRDQHCSDGHFHGGRFATPGLIPRSKFVTGADRVKTRVHAPRTMVHRMAFAVKARLPWLRYNEGFARTS